MLKLSIALLLLPSLAIAGPKVSKKDLDALPDTAEITWTADADGLATVHARIAEVEADIKRIQDERAAAKDAKGEAQRGIKDARDDVRSAKEQGQLGIQAARDAQAQAQADLEVKKAKVDQAKAQLKLSKAEYKANRSDTTKASIQSSKAALKKAKDDVRHQKALIREAKAAVKTAKDEAADGKAQAKETVEAAKQDKGAAKDEIGEAADELANHKLELAELEARRNVWVAHIELEKAWALYQHEKLTDLAAYDKSRLDAILLWEGKAEALQKATGTAAADTGFPPELPESWVAHNTPIAPPTAIEGVGEEAAAEDAPAEDAPALEEAPSPEDAPPPAAVPPAPAETSDL